MMYAPPTSLVVVTTSEIGVGLRVGYEQLAAIGLERQVHRRAAHVQHGFQAVGRGRMGVGPGQRDRHHLVTAGAGYEGLGRVGQNDRVRGAGAAGEIGAHSARRRIHQAHRISASIGHDHGFPVRSGTRFHRLLTGADRGNLPPRLQVENRDGVRTGIGHVGAVAGRIHVDRNRLPMHLDIGGDGIVLGVDHRDESQVAGARPSSPRRLRCGWG